MNDDELREHLRTTLDAVRPDQPDLAVLRRIARRRRRRLQATAATLGLLLIAGAGVGIAAATTSNSGRAQVVTAHGQTFDSTVTVLCGKGDSGQTITAYVQLSVGQTLALQQCPTPHDLILVGGDVLRRTGDLTFRAASVGSAAVSFTGPAPACQAVPAGAAPPPSCLAVVHHFDVTVTSGSMSRQPGPAPMATAESGHPTPGPGLVTTPCEGGRVSVAVGDPLHLIDCPVGFDAHVDDSAVLAPGSAPATFNAMNPGTTNVELYVKPQCSPGTMCPRYVRDLGTLVVTVTSRAGP